MSLVKRNVFEPFTIDITQDFIPEGSTVHFSTLYEFATQLRMTRIFTEPLSVFHTIQFLVILPPSVLPLLVLFPIWGTELISHRTIG
jgi:hypothetical protein